MSFRIARSLAWIAGVFAGCSTPAQSHTTAMQDVAAMPAMPNEGMDRPADEASRATAPAQTGMATAAATIPAMPSASTPIQMMSASAPSSSGAAGAASAASSSHDMDAAQAPAAPQRSYVTDLSDQQLATWGSSVCDGYLVPSGAAWPWTLEKKLAEIKGPKVLHVSTPGHNTDSKDSAAERARVADADFVVVCLSLGNQGLGSALTEANADAVVSSYVDDIFTDHDASDGDPVSMVDYIESIGAHPIVTLVYSMADYNTMHCKHVVEANIRQQSFGVPTINHLGPTNAGNNFGKGDCTWANGINAPINVQADARHPNQVGHDESFFAFPPDLPFALASSVAFPTRPETMDSITLMQNQANLEPIAYTPEYAMHGYTMQFSFRTAHDGTLATIALAMNEFLTLELKSGTVHLIAADGDDAVQDTHAVTDDTWHDLALTYSHVRQIVAIYVDGMLIGERDTRDGTNIRELFPQSFVLGGPGTSGRAPAPATAQFKDLFVNRAPLHAREIEERTKTDWVGAGSLDVYAPLRSTSLTENRAQTLQRVRVSL